MSKGMIGYGFKEDGFVNKLQRRKSVEDEEEEV
jgi:hypothetical protein